MFADTHGGDVFRWFDNSVSGRGRKGIEARAIRAIYLQSYVGATVAILLLSLGTLIATKEIDRRSRLDAVNQIEGVLSIADKAISSWAARQKNSTLAIAEYPTVIAEAIRLQEIYTSFGGVGDKDHQSGLRQFLQDDLRFHLIEGYFIVDAYGVSLASSRDDNVGETNQFFSGLYHFLPRTVGEVYITPPLKSDVLLPDANGNLVEGRATMFVVTPVVEVDGELLYLLVRLNPYHGFFDILERGRFRETGESYAFDENDYMVSGSRFEEELTALGMISSDQKSVLNVKVADPGVQLMPGMLSGGEFEEWPPTVMAAQAKQSGFGMNMDGYRNYRGNQVIGAWTWNEELDIGIATEVDHSEIYQTLFLTRQIIILSWISTSVLIIALTVIFTSFRKREAFRTSELEETVKERTRELGVQTERALVAAKEAAAASNAKSAFLANMSHEIRTPLNGVLGMAMVLEDTRLTKRQSEILDIIQSSADDLLTILNDILDFAKIESGHLQLEAIPFQLITELKSVEGLWSSQILNKGLEFNLDCRSFHDCNLIGDPTRLRQIFNNLLSNALKFTERGAIGVRVRQDVLSDCEIQTFVEVQDSGIGIPPDAQNSLFEQFTQVDSSMTRRFGGTGLGLAICRDLIREMGGEIEVESNPGQGTTFSFSIKNECEAVSAPAAEASSEESPQAYQTFLRDAGLQVLVAEDNPTNRQIIEVILKTGNITPTFARDGAQAVAAVEAGDFDLILMDIQMPTMDGIEATKAIQALSTEKSGTPIVALTANVMKEDLELYRATGMADVVTKPVVPEVLFQTIVKVVIEKTSHDFSTVESPIGQQA